MELNKTMEIGFFNLLLQYFLQYFYTMKEVQFLQCVSTFYTSVEFIRIRINLNVQGMSSKKHVTGKRQSMGEPSALGS